MFYVPFHCFFLKRLLAIIYMHVLWLRCTNIPCKMPLPHSIWGSFKLKKYSIQMLLIFQNCNINPTFLEKILFCNGSICTICCLYIWCHFYYIVKWYVYTELPESKTVSYKVIRQLSDIPCIVISFVTSELSAIN